MPFISICIPAYKRIAYLEKLLSSITIQKFKDYEVIISDDSSDETVEDFIKNYQDKFQISYIKNNIAIGTPANWNHAIKHASGEWIKLMHDDDWFLNENSLESFASATRSGNKFIVSAYTNYYLSSNRTELVVTSERKLKHLQKQPFELFASNIIGPPSVIMIHRSVTEKYDERMKWLVDIDYYMRILQNNKLYYINEPLIGVGLGDEQVTKVSFLNPKIELPESSLMLEKYGSASLKNIWVYDAWWRLIRNLKIRSNEQLRMHTNKPWPKYIEKIVLHQQKIPLSLLKVGAISKSFMLLSYTVNRSNL